MDDSPGPWEKGGTGMEGLLVNKMSAQQSLGKVDILFAPGDQLRYDEIVSVHTDGMSGGRVNAVVRDDSAFPAVG